MKTLASLSVLLLASLTLNANPYSSNAEEYNEVIKIGDRVSTELIKTLGKNLKSHMKSKGPMGAVKFCNMNALSLTDKVDRNNGKDIRVKRISLKYRNASNAPQGSEKSIMMALQTLKDEGAILPKFIVQNSGEAEIKYYKPLMINKGVCLNCHGNINKTKIGSFIKKNYPDDKAHDYKMGDLRGAIVVTIKK